MKTRACSSTVVTTLFALAITAPVLAQEQHQTADGETGKHHHYKLIDIGTLGGPQSYFNNLHLGDAFGFGTAFYGFAQVSNGPGVLVGFADTSTPDPYSANPLFCYVLDCFVAHAYELHNGVRTDLGTLPGGASSAAFWINSSGLIAGNSQNGELDPLIPGLPELRAVIWKDGRIADLGTLGGSSSFTQAVNNRGQVVGVAQNGISDPFSMYYQFLYCFPSNFQVCPPDSTETRAFLWDAEGGMEDIGTLGGPDAAAFLINQHGQIAGFSYTNSIPADPNTSLPATHPFLWEEGRGMKDLGTLGGVSVAAVNGLNERGEVVGGSDLPGDQQIHPFLWDGEKLIDLVAPPFGGSGNGEAYWINEAGEVVGQAGIPAPCTGSNPPDTVHHGFLWRSGGRMIDLGTLPGTLSSEANFINSHSQAVGDAWACDFSVLSATLWERGSLVDLNALVPQNPLHLFMASFIDDRGQIGAFGSLANGNMHAVLLIPCDEGHPDIDGCDYSLADAKAATEAQAVRGTRDSKLSAPGQARGPLSSKGALPAPRESTPVRQLLLPRLGFARFTGSVFPVTNDPALTSGPSATLSPVSLTFSTQAVGTTSAAETVALKNTGTTSLTISSIAITGTDHADFAQTHTCGSSLAAGASCSISVEFSPTASGTRTAVLSVTDNAAGSPQKVSLAGVGTTAQLSPTSLYFGAVGIGATSPAQFVTLTNVGTTPLTVTGIAITGADAADFAHNNCGSSLAPYASCNIRVTFTPTALSTRAAMLSVTDSAAGSPQKVSLAGVGTTARLSPTSLYFAPVTVGMTSPAQIVTLTNVGTTPLTVTGIAITGTDAADFAQTHTCGSSLAAGASCSISVTFKPKAPGLRNAALSVSDNASGRPQTVSLCGGCIPPGGFCFGPGPNRCCRAPRGHFAYCSDPTGWGTCVES